MSNSLATVVALAQQAYSNLEEARAKGAHSLVLDQLSLDYVKLCEERDTKLRRGKFRKKPMPIPDDEIVMPEAQNTGRVISPELPDGYTLLPGEKFVPLDPAWMDKYDISKGYYAGPVDPLNSIFMLEIDSHWYDTKSNCVRVMARIGKGGSRIWKHATMFPKLVVLTEPNKQTSNVIGAIFDSSDTEYNFPHAWELTADKLMKKGPKLRTVSFEELFEEEGI